MKKRNVARLVGLCVGCLFWVNAWALISPVTMLEGVSSRVIRSLEANKSRLKSISVIRGIVNRNLIPYIDRNGIAASVVGPQAWRQASSAQRSRFISLFTTIVVKTYANAFASYDGDKIKFYPLRVNYMKKNYVTVKSQLQRRSGQRIAMTYALSRAGASWRIYDFSVEGVSLVRSYRSQFAGVLRNSGMSGLLSRLQKRYR